MKMMHKLWLVHFVLLLFALNVSNASAETTVRMYPPEGTVYTDIFLQVRYDGHDGILYLIWDNITILTGVGQNLNDQNLALGFDITFNPPNVGNYSELGEHKIYIEIYYKVFVEEPSLHEEPRFYNTTLSFEIIEYYPPPEFQAIYDELLADYNTLNVTYFILQSNYTDLEGNYTVLQESYDSLQANYENLQTAYNTLLNYENLRARYEASINELKNTRNLLYAFVITTVVFIGATIYFAIRKPKVMPTSISEV